MINLKIDPEFQSQIPPLTDDEFKQLEENILKEGKLLSPLIVWNNTLVDGHNRYAILQKHPEICFSTMPLRFANREEALAWICKNQLGRRNLSATFSPDLADASIYVIDVAQGEKIPRKGGPGVTRSDLLVINKTDLAPLVGASLEVMASDSKRMRGDRPFLFTNLMSREGVSQVIDWIKKSVLFEDLK